MYFLNLGTKGLKKDLTMVAVVSRDGLIIR